jgi:citrate lyase beta subunit
MPQVSQSNVQTLILPKIHSHQDLDYVSYAVSSSNRGLSQRPDIQLVASIESARGVLNLSSIAGWKSSHNPQTGGELSAILVRFLYLLIKMKLIRA